MSKLEQANGSSSPRRRARVGHGVGEATACGLGSSPSAGIGYDQAMEVRLLCCCLAAVHMLASRKNRSAPAQSADGRWGTARTSDPRWWAALPPCWLAPSAWAADELCPTRTVQENSIASRVITKRRWARKLSTSSDAGVGSFGGQSALPCLSKVRS